jgi:hypothetical protein
MNRRLDADSWILAPERLQMQTMKRILKVDRGDINYLRSTIESYDGMAVVRTLDPRKAYIEIQISPGCENLVSELLDSLKEEDGIRLG